MKEGGLFLAKFLVFAAISLAVFSFALKPYAYVLMYVSDAAGRVAMGYDISERRVEGSGVGTEITFVYRDETRRLPAGIVAINVPPFIALILADRKLRWREKPLTLGIGMLVLFASHVLLVFLAFVLATSFRIVGESGLAQGVGTVTLALPFVLWILLVRRDMISRGFTKSGDKTERANEAGA